jgi:hypothetical protein
MFRADCGRSSDISTERNSHRVPVTNQCIDCRSAEGRLGFFPLPHNHQDMYITVLSYCFLFKWVDLKRTVQTTIL